MFNNFTSSGKHMICDFKEIKNTDLLNNCYKLRSMLREICGIYEFQILDELEHQFEPIGCSIIFMLSESHMSIHTFPEKAHISFDIYTCRQYDTNVPYDNLYSFIKRQLQASNKSNYTIIDRFF